MMSYSSCTKGVRPYMARPDYRLQLRARYLEGDPVTQPVVELVRAMPL